MCKKPWNQKKKNFGDWIFCEMCNMWVHRKCDELIKDG